MNNELEGIWEEAAMTHPKEIPYKSPGETQERSRKFSVRIMGVLAEIWTA